LIEEGENTGRGGTFEEIVRVQSRALEYRRDCFLHDLSHYVIIMALSVTYIFTTILITKIKSIYDNLHGDLPGITKAVVGASTFLQANPWVLIFPVVLIAVWMPTSKTQLPDVVLQILFGHSFCSGFRAKSAITRVCRSLSVLLDSGGGNGQALTITARSTGTIYSKKFLRIFGK
jgi:type II secretory pathway component PulF